MQLTAGSHVDRYVVLRPLGTGGMATVWLVRHQRLGSLHALKVLHSASASLRERLLREGQAQGGLRHSHVVSVTDVVDVDGMPGLVMEYVEGPDLAQLIAAHRLSVAEADALARPLLDGVLAAHRAGLIHRDLKPGNVLLAIEEERLVPKITDFGLAKALEQGEGSHRTRSGVAMGTPAYMAPEQVRDASRVDARADVFALGCLLYELVTGRTAFVGADSFELLDKVVHARFEDVRSLCPSLPDEMVDAIHGALVPELDARIPSVEALRATWIGERPEPGPVWGPLLAAARDLAERAPHAQEPSTYGGADHTWAEPPPEAPPSLEPSAEPVPRIAAGWRPWLAGAGLLALLGLAALPALRSEAPAPPAVAQAPQRVMSATAAAHISEDPVIQQQFAEAWQAFLDADFRTAERKLEVVVGSDPDAPLPWFLLAQTRLARDDATAGVEAVWKSLEKAQGYDSPLAELLPHLARIATAEGWEGEHAQAYFDYLEAHPDDYLLPIVPLYSPASVDAPDAIVERLFAEALARDPRPAVPYAMHASGLLSRGYWDQALSVTERGLERAPGSPALLARKGAAELYSGEFAAAKDTLLAATRADPGVIEAEVDLALAAHASGDQALYDEISKRLLGPLVSPEERMSLVLGTAWTLAGEGDVDGALALIEAHEDEARAQGAWGLVYEYAGQRGELFRLLGEIDAYAATQARLKEAVGAPELGPLDRQRFSEVVLVRDAWLAAQRGELDEARAIRARLAALPQANPRNLATIDHDLAVAEGRPEDLRPELFDERCGPRIRYALDVHAAGGEARPLLEAAAHDPTCSAIGTDRLHQARARAALDG